MSRSLSFGGVAGTASSRPVIIVLQPSLELPQLAALQQSCRVFWCTFKYANRDK